MGVNAHASTEKRKACPPSFDLDAYGGLLTRETILVVGATGGAKTTIATQFLGAGITHAGEAGVCVTFAEPPAGIRLNAAALGWDIRAWEAAGQWAFVDVSPSQEENVHVAGLYDLGALLARVEFAIRRVKARRVSLDSVDALFRRLADAALVRSELLRLLAALQRTGVATLLTTERTSCYSAFFGRGVEKIVADNLAGPSHGVAGEFTELDALFINDPASGIFPFVTRERYGKRVY